MVQFRRLDPLANAGPFQRLQKTPVKSFTLLQPQFERLQERRPDLVILEDDAGVIGLPNRDYLEIHYAFPEVEAFRDDFNGLFNRIVGASSKEEAPRGVLLSFRDRPNRNLADVVFWSLALDEGEQWVEMNHVGLPEMDEPGDEIEGGFKVRPATLEDKDAIVAVEAAATGLPPLSDGGVASLIENTRWLRLVSDAAGAPVGLLVLRTEPGGWGIVQHIFVRPDLVDALRRPLLDWCIAFLRNNGGRRVRRQVYTEDAAGLALLREMGFTPGETGLDFTRPVSAEEIQAKIDERQSHGTLIKFGDWR